MRKGTLRINEDGVDFSQELSSNGQTGTLIPATINAHTHIGDSFVDTEPHGDIAEVFGPGGFKDRMLRSSNTVERSKGMSMFLRHMAITGTCLNVDFREGGIQGVMDVPFRDEIKTVILGRASKMEEAGEILDVSSGLTISSISDLPTDDMLYYSEKARERGKIFAMHLSERVREDVDIAIGLKPSFLVHCIECSDEDLKKIAKERIPVVITPRSNIMFGKRPNYARFINFGMDVFLGTDNCMTVEPDMFSEMAFLYTYQRSLERIDPDAILNMATYAPISFFSSLNISIPRRYIFFPNKRLSSYSIVTRGHVYQKKAIYP